MVQIQPTQTIALEPEQEPTESAALSDVAGYCRDLYEEYRNSDYRQRKLKEITAGRKRYAGDRDPKTFPWKGCSNKSMMLDAIAIDNLEPRIKSQLVAEEDFINAVPTGQEDVGSVDSVEDFMNWAVRNNMKVDDHAKRLVHDLLLDGTKDVIPIWREAPKTNRIRTIQPIWVGSDGQPVNLPINPQALNPQILQQMGFRQEMQDSFEEREETTFKVDLELVDINQCFFPDGEGHNFEEQPYLRLIYPTLYELIELSEKNGGPYTLPENPEDLVVDPSRQSDEHQSDDEHRKGIQHSEYSKQVKLLECYVKWENEWVIATFAIDAGWTEVRRQPMSEVYWHERKPVHRFKVFPEDNESMGTGIPTKIGHFSVGIDDLYNQMIDSGVVEIIPWGFVQEEVGLAKDFKIVPGHFNTIPKGSQPFFANAGVKSPQFITFIQLLQGFFERLVSLSDYTLGRESSTAGKGGDTFSGMSLIVQEGNIKHAYTSDSLQDQFGRLLTDCLTLYAQYMPIDAKRRIFENDQWVFQPIDVLSIQGSYDIKIQVSNASANKMLNRREAVEKMQMTAQNPMVNQVKTLEDFFKAYDVKQPTEYINPNFAMVVQALQQFPELPQVIQQYAQQKTQQMRQQQIAGEAQANVQRQDIERQVEAPLEERKLVDQVQEGIKRKLLTQAIEQRAGLQTDGGR